MDIDPVSSKEHAIQEQMRYRDLVMQVKRFIKYAPKGTDHKVLVREVMEFDRRLTEFRKSFGSSETEKLRKQLKKIAGMNEVK